MLHLFIAFYYKVLIKYMSRQLMKRISYHIQ